MVGRRARATGLRACPFLAAGAALICLLLSAAPAKATFPGEDGQISFGAGPNIYLVDPDGSNVVSLSDHPAFAPSIGGEVPYSEAVTFSADGTRVLFSHTPRAPEGSEIFVTQMIGFDGDSAARLTTLQGWDAGRFSPDGTQVVFEHRHQPGGEGPVYPDGIYLMEADGSNLQPLTLSDGGYGEVDPEFTANGRWIVFISDRGPPPNEPGTWTALYRMHPDGTDLQRITDRRPYGDGGPESLSVSPDGREVAYSDGRDIWVTSVHRPDPVRVTDDSPRDPSGATPNQDYSPVYSPSGRWIAFMSNRAYSTEEATYSPQADVWRIKPNGSDPRRVTHFVEGAGHPAEKPFDWAPAPPNGIVDCGPLEVARRLVGTDSVETLRGADGEDLIIGHRAADRLLAGDGTDCAFGETGRDRLVGHGGADLLVGGSGADVMRGGRGTDVLRCGSGRDRAYVDAGETTQGCEKLIRR